MVQPYPSQWCLHVASNQEPSILTGRTIIIGKPHFQIQSIFSHFPYIRQNICPPFDHHNFVQVLTIWNTFYYTSMNEPINESIRIVLIGNSNITQMSFIKAMFFTEARKYFSRWQIRNISSNFAKLLAVYIYIFSSFRSTYFFSVKLVK